MSKSIKMAKNSKSRAYHRRDTQALNRTALVIGGVAAVVILLAMVISFIR